MEGLNNLIDQNKIQFNKIYGIETEFTAVAPGRINIIGEHTDYNQGLSMPAGIDRWVVISMASRKDEKINIYSLNFQSWLKTNTNEQPKVRESWQKYIFGCFKIFSESYPVSTGFDAIIYGNVPIGSGVSSSAAIEVSMMNALRKLYLVNFDDLTLIKLCQQVEHQYLKVKSGLLDQYASQFSKDSHLLLLDFQDLQHQYIPANFGKYTWVLVDSKVKRELAGSKYSERVAETQQALKIIQSKFPEVRQFRDINEEHVQAVEDKLLLKRISHYFSENNRVKKAAECIKENDFEALGNLLVKSHTSLSVDYEVSCEELDFLLDAALKFPHCLGGRMMGGGFGGCTINMVSKSQQEKFADHMIESYWERFNIQAEVNIYRIVDGAGIHS
ncbi:galactokinase [soil metagenome]